MIQKLRTSSNGICCNSSKWSFIDINFNSSSPSTTSVLSSVVDVEKYCNLWRCFMLLYRFILLWGGIVWEVVDHRLLFANDWSFVNFAAQLLLLLKLDPIKQSGSKDNGIDERCRILPARYLQPFISTYKYKASNIVLDCDDYDEGPENGFLW